MVEEHSRTLIRSFLTLQNTHKFSYPRPHQDVNDSNCSLALLLLLLFVNATRRPPPGGTKIILTLFSLISTPHIVFLLRTLCMQTRPALIENQGGTRGHPRSPQASAQSHL